jgi:hypothetical protein
MENLSYAVVNLNDYKVVSWFDSVKEARDKALRLNGKKDGCYYVVMKEITKTKEAKK